MINFKQICAVILLTSCGVLSAQAATPPANNFSDASKTIMVSQNNPEFTLTLKSNPTTGFTWLVEKYDANFVTVVKHVYQPPISQLVGAGGRDVWQFKLNPSAFSAPHVLKITMLYARPWAAQQGGNETEFTVVTH